MRASRARGTALRARYEHGFRELIEHGMKEGAFEVRSARLVSYAILDVGMEIFVWYREGCGMSEDGLVYAYADHELRIVGYGNQRESTAG